MKEVEAFLVELGINLTEKLLIKLSKNGNLIIFELFTAIVNFLSRDER